MMVHTNTGCTTERFGVRGSNPVSCPCGKLGDIQCFPPAAVLLITFDKLGETLAGAAVVQREACLALLLHAEAWWLHFGEGEAKVLVQVVQLIDEVAHISPQDLQKMEDDDI